MVVGEFGAQAGCVKRGSVARGGDEHSSRVEVESSGQCRGHHDRGRGLDRPIALSRAMESVRESVSVGTADLSVSPESRRAARPATVAMTMPAAADRRAAG